MISFVRFARKEKSWYTFWQSLMEYTLRKCSAAFFVLAGIFLLCPGPAEAKTFSLPQQLNHAGLSFSSPLTFSKPTKVKAATTKIEFIKLEKVDMNKKKEAKAVEARVLPSTQVKNTTKTENKVLAMLPTPTIYIAPLPGTKLPTPTPKLYTPKPTTVQTTVAATATQVPTQQPAVVSANVGGLDAEKLFNMSNAYRQARGLPAFEKEGRSCSLAASRAPEIAGEVASGALHSGLHARALPYWNTENIISMNSEEAAFNWWVNDPIHHDAIVGNYKYSCVACAGNNCAQEFTNFQPK